MSNPPHQPGSASLVLTETAAKLGRSILGIPAIWHPQQSVSAMVGPRRISGFVAKGAGLPFLAFMPVLGTARAEAPTPVTTHFSAAGLERVRDYMRNEVSTGKIPGAVLLIQQHGQSVLLESFGMRDVESKTPMTSDTIFRLYSMSKPITSVAAMMLVDDGKLSLDDPLSKYIPAFADVRVATETREADAKISLATEPLARPITILDLLR